MMVNNSIRNELRGIIDAYNYLILGIEKRARESNDRAYGGIIRSGKGKLVESIAQQLVRIAWSDLGAPEEKLTFVHRSIVIPIRKNYIKRIKSKEIKEYIKNNISRMYYRITPDVQVHVKDRFALSIECKAYSENAMLKRILVDSTLVKHIYPNVKFLLLQLESQLGGDYSDIFKEIHYGSPSTHTLLSYFDIDLNIITLLKGERKVDQPIHKKEYFKPLTMESLIKALNVIKELLRQ